MREISKLWTIKFSKTAWRQLEKADNTTLDRIIDYLENRVATSSNPKLLAKPLSGPLSGYWRFRVGDYRLICKIKDHELVILITEIAHRKEIYRNFH